MRRPTPLLRLLAWHRQAMAGDAPAIHDGFPECGWYKTRFVKNGPWVAVEIICDRDVDEIGELSAPEKLVAIVEGRRRAPAPIWTYLTPITRAEHARLETERLGGGRMAATMARIDLAQEPSRP